MKFSASFRLPSAVSLRPLSQPSTPAVVPEHPSVVVLRRKLVACALERPRFRTDLDVLVIVQFLAGLDAFAGVALPALHCSFVSPVACEVYILHHSDIDRRCTHVLSMCVGTRRPRDGSRAPGTPRMADPSSVL